MSWKYVVLCVCCASLYALTSFPDKFGYILYCPCIGEFGDQAQHLLDALAFAKGLNRTLVVPPWVIYTMPNVSVLIPYNSWFSLPHLQNYHKVVTMQYFVEEIAYQHWPKDNRTGYCRNFDKNRGNMCQMDQGNPIGTFWLDQNITFTEYMLHPIDHWNTANDSKSRDTWQKLYPPHTYLVLAFRRPPGRKVESTSEIEKIQKFLRFSPDLLQQVYSKLQKLNISVVDLVAVQILSKTYLNNICSLNTSFNHGEFFSVSQCTGLDCSVENRTKFTYEACNPDLNVITGHISSVIDDTNSTSLLISTDRFDDHIVQIINQLDVWHDNKVKMFVEQSYGYNNHEELLTDLVIMSKAKFFIGNCIDAYSSFVRRERQIWNRPYSFFGIDQLSDSTCSNSTRV